MPLSRLSFPFVCVVALGLAAGCASAQSRVRIADEAGFPVRLCLPLDAATRAAVSRGDTRLDIALRHRAPRLRYSPAFRVAVVDASGVRQEIHAFGMQPDVVERGRPAAQRFAVDLRGVRLMPDARGRACFEIERNADAAGAGGEPAAMELSIRWHPMRSP